MSDNDDMDIPPICHVYAQHAYHSPATIEGERLALERIRDAIDLALKTGMDAEATVMAGDGEGYGIEVKIRSPAYLNAGRLLPYYAAYAGGVGAREFQRETENIARMEEARRAHREKKS
jgi:hypothetical protein